MEIDTVPHEREHGNARTSLLPRIERLAVFVPNWLGDAIMSLPALADIRRALPSSALLAVARRPIAKLFELVPGIESVTPIVGGLSSAGDTKASLRALRADAALLFPNSFYTAMVAWHAGIPERWGYRSDLRTPLLTRAFDRPTGVHQAEYYQRLVAALGIVNGPARPQVVVSPEARVAGREALLQGGWDGSSPLVGIAPGAAYGTAKRWPPESFAAVATRLSEVGARTVMVGSRLDRSAADEVNASTPVAVIDLVGRTELTTLAGVLVHCKALVTNDSGAMHMAAACNVPVVALFGPTNEHETRPLAGADTTVVVHDVWCRPCMLRDCPIGHRCMRGIAVDTVMAAVHRSL